ncbi:MAG: hypothetical protein JWR59_2527 [Brevundimonas sp.]|nr:hypothetical protein [Brevundimonas sp.]
MSKDNYGPAIVGKIIPMNPTPDPQEEDELYKATEYVMANDAVLKHWSTENPGHFVRVIERTLEYTQAHKLQWELEARIKYERSGMAFVHATVLELTDDTKLLKKLEDNVQVRLSELTKLKETK